MSDKYEFKSCKKHYCYGCSNFYNTTKENFFEYIKYYTTYGPGGPAGIPESDAKACTNIITTCCLPFKLVYLIPVCPCVVFCPRGICTCCGEGPDE